MKCMKLLPAVLALSLLASCGMALAEDPAPGSPPACVPAADGAGADPQSARLAPGAEETVLTCRIVDGAEEGVLLLAELGEGLYGGTGVYRLDAADIPVTLDGQAADVSALEDGMTIDVSFNGNVAETFPARLGEVYGIGAWSIGQGKTPGGSCYDLCGLYLQVLDDLWRRDPALNEDIAAAGLDLSTAPGGLTDSEKSALAWRFGELHGVEVVAGTFQELREQGYLTAAAIDGSALEEGREWVQWEDGCLFSITPGEGHEDEIYSLPVVFFNAEKWRTPLAAYCFHDCSAVWPEFGTWSGYQIGGEMIS